MIRVNWLEEAQKLLESNDLIFCENSIHHFIDCDDKLTIDDINERYYECDRIELIELAKTYAANNDVRISELDDDEEVEENIRDNEEFYDYETLDEYVEFVILGDGIVEEVDDGTYLVDNEKL